MYNVVDLFSRKPLDVIAEQNRDVDVEWLDENARYIGVLTNRDRDTLRSLSHEIALLDEQRDKIDSIREDMCDRYFSQLTRSLTYLETYTPNQYKVDIDKDKAYIDDRGNVWNVYNGQSESEGQPEQS